MAAVTELGVEGYRSLREVWIRLKRINVIVGANGSGKSNLYRTLALLAAACEGRFAKALGEEGGIPSVLWAGKRGKGSPRMKITVKIDDLKYEIEAGIVTPGASPFPLDPEIKEEQVSYIHRGDKVVLLKRAGQAVHARDAEGKRVTYPLQVPPCESVLSELKEPHRFPELSALRQEILSWRFYHKFRTDDESPLRQPQLATRTMSLTHDARDLASALITIGWVGDADGLDSSIDNAFPGASLAIAERNGRLALGMHMPGFDRPFDTRELSDGTLHYLCLLAALLSPRPAGFIALNEPEASIHPDLLRPLADLVVSASKTSQIWLTTHSQELASMIAEKSGVSPLELVKEDGATKIKKAESSD